MNNFRCGLVRISEDFHIIDKNKAVKRIAELPKRGASVLPLLGESGKKLLALDCRPFKSCVLCVHSGNRRLSVTAIREETGTILILFHPLLSMMRFAENASGEPKIPMYFIRGLLGMIYNSSDASYVPKGISEGFASIDFSVKNMMFTEDVMKRLAEKLGKTNFVRPMTVRFEKKTKDRMFLVDYQTTIYALSELLYADSVIAGEGSADIKIISEVGGLTMTLSDRCRERMTPAETTYLKLTESVLRLAGAWMETEKYGSKRMIIKVSVPAKQFTYRLRTPAAVSESALFSYFDYAIAYYLLGDTAD